MTWHFTNMSDVEWYWYSHPTHFYDIGRKKKTGIGGECSGAKLGARGRLGGLFVVDSGFPIWRFPKIEVPPKSSISRWIFHHKPSMLGSPHWKIPSKCWPISLRWTVMHHWWRWFIAWIDRLLILRVAVIGAGTVPVSENAPTCLRKLW